MKRWIPLFLILGACASGGSSISLQGFYDVPVGASSEEVVGILGAPISQNRLPDGSIEYEYIERFKVGERNLNERRYVIILKDGKVVSKKMKQTSPLPYGFDSYEMQTTQKSEEE